MSVENSSHSIDGAPMHEVMQSDPELIVKFLEHIENALIVGSHASVNERFGIKTGLAEGITNAMKHGNEYRLEKLVKLRYQVLPHQFIIEITDEGAGFDPDDVADPTDPENNLRVCGRGLLMMRHYMTEVAYTNGGRTLRMCKLFKTQNSTKATNEIVEDEATNVKSDVSAVMNQAR